MPMMPLKTIMTEYQGESHYEYLSLRCYDCMNDLETQVSVKYSGDSFIDTFNQGSKNLIGKALKMKVVGS